jgi:hypothetical protein
MLWLVVCCLSCCRRLFSLVVAVSTFGHSTARRYNNTHCTYGVNLKHEGSISELHCAKSFFLARARTVLFFANNNTLPCDVAEKLEQACRYKTKVPDFGTGGYSTYSPARICSAHAFEYLTIAVCLSLVPSPVRSILSIYISTSISTISTPFIGNKNRKSGYFLLKIEYI